MGQANLRQPKWKIRVFVKIGFFEKNITWFLGSEEEGLSVCHLIMKDGGLEIKQEDGSVKFCEAHKFELFQVD